MDHNKIVCRVQNDGKISNYKGINVPGIYLSLPYMSEKDKMCIRDRHNRSSIVNDMQRGEMLWLKIKSKIILGRILF